MWGRIPPWLLQVLAQVAVYEVMNDLRIAAVNLHTPGAMATSTNPTSGNQIDRILEQVGKREKRMKVEFSQDDIEWDRMIRRIASSAVNSANSSGPNSPIIASATTATNESTSQISETNKLPFVKLDAVTHNKKAASDTTTKSSEVSFKKITIVISLCVSSYI